MELAGISVEKLIAWSPIALFAALASLELAIGHGSVDSGQIRRIGTNIGLYVVSALVAAAVPMSVAGSATWAAQHGFGLFNHVSAPAIAVLITAIAARSFAAYWLHRAAHQFPLLWRLHRIHHTDRHVDLSVGLRHHPAELIPAILVFGLVTALLGLPVWAALLTEAVMVAGNFWEHLAIRVPSRIKVMLEPWLVLPETHLIHHSAYRPQTDSNFSTLTIVWDRLFGTFRASSEAITRIGLGDFDDKIADNLWRQLAAPLRPPLVFR